MSLQAAAILQHAADKGHVESALHYAKFVKTSNPLESLRYFEKAWEMGNYRGFIGMAEASLKFVGQTNENRIIEFAYRYTAKAIQLSLFDGLSGRVTYENEEHVISFREFQYTSDRLL